MAAASEAVFTNPRTVVPQAWVRATSKGTGCPTDCQGRIGIAVSADPNRIYALVEAKENGGMYRSDDSGAGLDVG